MLIMKKTIIRLVVSMSMFYDTACTQLTNSNDTVNSGTSTSTSSTSFISDSVAQKLKIQKAEIARQMNAMQLTYFVTKVADGKFGYMILTDGKIYIEQKTIPAIEGNRGFATSEDAEKIAKLAIEKLKRGEVPPSITVEELKARGIQ